VARHSSPLLPAGCIQRRALLALDIVHCGVLAASLAVASAALLVARACHGRGAARCQHVGSGGGAAWGLSATACSTHFVESHRVLHAAVGAPPCARGCARYVAHVRVHGVACAHAAARDAHACVCPWQFGVCARCVSPDSIPCVPALSCACRTAAARMYASTQQHTRLAAKPSPLVPGPAPSRHSDGSSTPVAASLRCGLGCASTHSANFLSGAHQPRCCVQPMCHTRSSRRPCATARDVWRGSVLLCRLLHSQPKAASRPRRGVRMSCVCGGGDGGHSFLVWVGGRPLACRQTRLHLTPPTWVGCLPVCVEDTHHVCLLAGGAVFVGSSTKFL
jgi:hypothetical protein